MKPCKKTACNECPYRRTSIPGWLGPYDLKEYSEPIKVDIMVPCHKTADNDLEGRPLCTGLVATRVNSCKRAMFPGILQDSENLIRESIPSEQRNEEFFSFAHEFEKHHKTENNGKP